MYIIFDSNIWISELGLKSTLGSTVRFFVKTKGAVVVVPEVIKLETERNLKSALTKYVADLEKNYRQLLAIFGKLKEQVLPDTNAIDSKVAAIFGECQLELLEIPLSLESARSSFLKTIDKIPPSDKDQQFKDGVIWAECVRLLETDDVYLVTNDKAFFKGREPKYNNLAEALRAEVENAEHSIYLFDTLSALLQEIRSEVILDEDVLAREYWESNCKTIETTLESNSFTVIAPPNISTELYVTEDPNKLYAEFSISYQCEDLLADGRSNAVLLLNGSGTYSLNDKQFSGFRTNGEELSFVTHQGEEKCVRNAYFYSDGMVFGHKTVEHVVKSKIVD